MKNYIAHLQNTHSTAVFRAKAGKLAGFIGLGSNLLLALLKIILGLFTHSVSIMADGINNLSDCISSFLTVLGFYVAEKPADEKHPFGHERFEAISGMFISILVTFVGLQFLKTSVERILTPVEITIRPLIFLVLLFSIAIKLWQSYSYRMIGKEIASPTLKAASQDSINDSLTTGLILISSLVQLITNWSIDGYVGLAVAFYILFSGIQMIQSFTDDLLGEVPSQDEIQNMEVLLSSYPKILGFHDLIFHTYGASNRFATVHIEIDDRYTLEHAHEMIDAIEKDFLDQLTIQLVCHVDPVDIKNTRRQFVKKKMKRFLNYLDRELTLHDFRLHVIDGKESLTFDVVVPRKARFTDSELIGKIKQYGKDEFHIDTINVVFDHNYLLRKKLP